MSVNETEIDIAFEYDAICSVNVDNDVLKRSVLEGDI